MMFHEIEREALTARMRCLAIIAVVAIGAFVEGLDTAPAGVRQTTSGLRMYVFNCGTLKDRSPETYNLARDRVESVDMSDPCFLIVHPRGSLLWETGLNGRMPESRRSAWRTAFAPDTSRERRTTIASETTKDSPPS